MASLRFQAPARPAAPATEDLAFFKIRYNRPDGGTSHLLEHPVRDGHGAVSRDLSFAAAVAGFGMLLRESEHRGSLTLADVIRIAERSRGDDPEGYRAEFVRLPRIFGEIDRGGRSSGDEHR